MMLEGKLLRLATMCKIDREDFLQTYQNSEMDTKWISKIKKKTSKQWKLFVDKHAQEINEIRSAIKGVAEEIKMPISEYRKLVTTIKKAVKKPTRPNKK